MNKILKVLIFLAILWGGSYLIALAFFGGGNSGIPTGSSIAVIPVQGMITLTGSNGLLKQTTSAETIVERIEKASEDPSIKGIVLDINSPGGTVLGSKIVADAVKQVDKPVVSVISEFGTSGAYWIASQSDLIIADELSIVGSIGVIGSYLDFSGLLDDYNVSYNRLVTGDFKDINSPLKPMTNEEEELVQERLDTIHNYFVQDVATGRGMGISEIDALAEGLFYLGLDSIDIGLVDELGNKDYAINRTKEMAGLKDGRIQEFTDEISFFDQLKEYTTHSSFYIGQGIGSVLVSGEAGSLDIKV